MTKYTRIFKASSPPTAALITNILLMREIIRETDKIMFISYIFYPFNVSNFCTIGQGNLDVSQVFKQNCHNNKS